MAHYIPQQTRECVSKIECFHDVDRQTAENLLLHQGADGSFLVRPSNTTPGDYALSVRLEDEIIHYKIHSGGEFLDLYGGEQFASLQELIEFYKGGHGTLEEENGRVSYPSLPLVNEETRRPHERSGANTPWFHRFHRPPFWKKWNTVRLLGRGSFGEVHEVIADTGIRCAAKTIRLPMQHGTQMDVGDKISKWIDSESNLCQLHHINIVMVFSIKKKQDSTVVVFMEYIDGLPLKEFLEKSNLDEDSIRDFSNQICSALHYLHSREPPVIHRDINGNNIMVQRVNEGNRIKLIDFGLSVKMRQGCSHYSASTPEAKGTVNFMAPELIAADDVIVYSKESDIWAFGCTVYLMVTGTAPYSGKTDWWISELVKTKGAPHLPDRCSAELKNFYNFCVARDRKARKSAADLLRHEFLTGMRDEGATGGGNERM